MTVLTLGTPTSGTAIINGDGTVSHTPSLDFKGVITFTYTVADPSGAEATGLVTINYVTAFTWTGLGGNSNWSNGANWCGNILSGECTGAGSPPTIADQAFFNDACTACSTSIDTDISVLGITLMNSYLGTISLNSGIDISVGQAGLNIDNGSFLGSDGAMNFEVYTQSDGTFTATSGTVTLGNVPFGVGTIDKFSVSGGTYNHNFGTLLFNSTGACSTLVANITVPTPVSVYHLRFDLDDTSGCSGGPYVSLNSASTLVVDGDLTFADGYVTGSGNIEFNGDLHFVCSTACPKESSVNITATGDRVQTYFYENGANAKPGLSLDTTGSLIPDNGITDFYIGKLNLYNGTFTAPPGKLYIGFGVGTSSMQDGFIITNGDFSQVPDDIVFNHRTSCGATALVIDTPTDFVAKNVTFNLTRGGCGADGKVDFSGKTLTVAGNLDISGQGIFNNGNIDIMGNGTFGCFSGDCIDGGSVSLTFKGGEPQQVFQNVGSEAKLPTGTFSVNKSGLTLELTSNLDLSLTGSKKNFDQLAGVLDLSSFNITGIDTFKMIGGSVTNGGTITYDTCGAGVCP